MYISLISVHLIIFNEHEEGLYIYCLWWVQYVVRLPKKADTEINIKEEYARVFVCTQFTSQDQPVWEHTEKICACKREMKL